MVELHHPTLIPAEAGNQAFYLQAALFTAKTWVPAYAGTSGKQ
jgi:hypothetical protein